MWRHVVSDERLLKRYRILRKADFDRVYQRRQSVADGVIVVYGCENGLDHPRLGLSVSRRVGPAVLRNRWKRVIREVFRRMRTELPPGIDLVVAPRQGAEPATLAVRPSLLGLAQCVERKLTKAREKSEGPTR